ncbi:unnamed protein product [Rhodiola kirilowii]
MAGGCILDLKIESVIVGEMCDLSDKLLQGSECTDNPSKKLCVDCGTSKTPLWRGGPAGPKSLCNACGIRSRKKRRALLEMSKANDKKLKPEKKIKCVDHFNSSSSSSSNNNNGHSDSSSCKDKLIAMLHVLKQSDVRVEELSEEQQAAVLLMAMSHGFNYD